MHQSGMFDEFTNEKHGKCGMTKLNNNAWGEPNKAPGRAVPVYWNRYCLIAISFIGAVYLLATSSSPQSCVLQAVMARIASWLATALAVLSPVASIPTITDLSGNDWTVTSPSLNISVPGNVPSSVRTM